MSEATARKPSSTEEEFFVREDAEKRRKLALAVKREAAVAELNRLREMHHMRCPKCGAELQATSFRGVEVDLCGSCGGFFLDAGEIDRVERPEANGVLAALREWIR
jgi:hypothetical protein